MAPDLPPHLEPLTLTPDDAADGESWEGVAVGDAALAEIDARALGFVESRLERVDLSGATLMSLFLSECELVRCDLSNARVHAGSARRVTFTESRLTGLAWTKGELRESELRDCRANLSSFEGSRFERVTFAGCDLRDADLRSARFEHVTFDGCDLTGADIGLARFSGTCVMRGCTLDGLSGVDRLRGVSMPWPDVLAAAATFAIELGVNVLDEREEAARKPPPL